MYGRSKKKSECTVRKAEKSFHCYSSSLSFTSGLVGEDVKIEESALERRKNGVQATFLPLLIYVLPRLLPKCLY
jgi:hypothetical protein